MRVLHVGNVANNAYLNAKLQRRAGIEADALCDEWHLFSQPEWEDAPLEGSFDELERLTEAAARVGWQRPPWVFVQDVWSDDPAGVGRLSERVRLAASIPRLVPLYRELRREYEPLRTVLDTDLRFVDLLRATNWRKRLDRTVTPLAPLFRRYDVVQANGPHPILCLLAGTHGPWIAFEHGTLREIPFQDSWMGRLLSVAYRRAHKVVLTNSDTIAAARRLGLENTEFVPHPIDETKYAPGPSHLRERLDAEERFLLLSPSSHNWHIKGNDVLLQAFAAFVREARSDALLVTTEWGLDLDRSRNLIAALGIGGHVRWVPPLPKWQLIDAYRAADVVLDQFLIGTFGAVAPEAMACGRPVIMAFDADVHRWCFSELPPILAARTPDEIVGALVRLAERPDEGERIGREGRRWIESHHSWRLVVNRYRAIYDEALAAHS